MLQGLYREKSRPGPCIYSKSVNITVALYGKVAIWRFMLNQKMQYYSGFMGESRVQVPLYTAKVSILQGFCSGFVRSKALPLPGGSGSPHYLEALEGYNLAL